MALKRLLPAVLAATVSLTAAHAADFSKQVKTQSGTVAGATAQGVLSFKGIPYAQPPVGKLRWRAPLPAKPWKGVRQATKYGHDCMQLAFPADDAPIRTKPSEDCLFLNVWRPAGSTATPLPVMVWIYGGGFTIGGTSPAAYDGSNFARDGVILVSLNYRLGRFGFFAHPALTAEDPAGPLGNYGYMDQIAALQWVQQNIAAFGGDPHRVTIFGESAGGGSVHMLMSAPQSKGLFAGAVVESGGGRGNLMGPRRLAKDLPGTPSGEAIGVNFAKSQGIEATGRRGLARLRALSADKVQAGVGFGAPRQPGPPTSAGPMADGQIVISAPDVIFKAGSQAQVPFMIGANTADIPNMDESARFVAATLSARGQKVFEYRFAYVVESMRDTWKTGAPHAKEIPFVFDTLTARYGSAVTAHDAAVAKATHAYWVNFGKSGDPNGPGLAKWPAYAATSDQLMLFQADGVAAGQQDPWKERLDVAAQRAESPAAKP
jgi:para-nitrobenzyl esterase